MRRPSVSSAASVVTPPRTRMNRREHGGRRGLSVHATPSPSRTPGIGMMGALPPLTQRLLISACLCGATGITRRPSASSAASVVTPPRTRVNHGEHGGRRGLTVHATPSPSRTPGIGMMGAHPPPENCTWIPAFAGMTIPCGLRISCPGARAAHEPPLTGSPNLSPRRKPRRFPSNPSSVPTDGSRCRFAPPNRSFAPWWPV